MRPIRTNTVLLLSELSPYSTGALCTDVHIHLWLRTSIQVDATALFIVDESCSWGLLINQWWFFKQLRSRAVYKQGEQIKPEFSFFVTSTSTNYRLTSKLGILLPSLAKHCPRVVQLVRIPLLSRTHKGKTSWFSAAAGKIDKTARRNDIRSLFAFRTSRPSKVKQTHAFSRWFSHVIDDILYLIRTTAMQKHVL